MPNKRYVVLPAPVRRRCGVRPGEQVLVVADPNHDVLVVHPLAALDSMITAYHASLVDGGAGGDHAVPYWNRLEARWGDRTIDEPTPSEIQQLAEEIKATAVVRRNSRAGRSTAPTMGDAALCRLTGLVAARAQSASDSHRSTVNGKPCLQHAFNTDRGKIGLRVVPGTVGRLRPDVGDSATEEDLDRPLLALAAAHGA